MLWVLNELMHMKHFIDREYHIRVRQSQERGVTEVQLWAVLVQGAQLHTLAPSLH